MICEKCKCDMSSQKDPWCMYQVADDGTVTNKMFNPDKIPRGWYDSPGAARKAKEKREEKVNGNSPGSNKQRS